MRATYVGLLTLIIAVGAPSAGANAQPPASDPDADSPSGTIYQLPLDTARQDAVPPTSGQPPASGGGTPSGSAIRSENGFSSSSTVPGTPPDSTLEDSSTARTPSSGSRPKDDRETPAAASGVPDDVVDADGGPSPELAIALLAVIAAVGTAVGASASRIRKSR